MTILEALKSLNNWPIDNLSVEKICIERGLTYSDAYSGSTQAFELASADVYVWQYLSGDVSEQEVSLSKGDREGLYNAAQKIYADYDDPKAEQGRSFGYIGEDWNA